MESHITFEIPTNLDIESIAIPRNYTVFVRALEHVAFGGEKPHRHHAMTQAEYDRFVSDMWIGIVLTMVVVFIVFALCFWYMYHKFQQWKRNYDARSRQRANATGAPTIDLEALPNYTLVSGLPTYDDALEQLRLSSTNHLLINHQTLMKLFGSVQEKSEKLRPETPVPTYEDAVGVPTANDVNLSNTIISSHSSNDITENSSSDSDASLKLNRFKCTIVDRPNEPNNNLNETPSSSSQNQFSLVVGNSLGSLNIINEIRNSKPEVPWLHRSAASLHCDTDNPTMNLARSEHRSSLY